MRLRIKEDLLPAQREFLAAKDRFLAMFGGYGSGKSHGLMLKLLQLADANRGVPGGLVCPTNKMFKRDVLPLFMEICDKHGIEAHYKRSDGEIHLPWTQTVIYIFHGEDSGASIRGPNLGWMLMNEMTLLDWETFKAAIGRVRRRDAKLPQIAGSGTPENFNWAYDSFIDKPMKNSRVIYADSRANKFTAEGYIGMLMDSYDAIAAQQYVGGKWVPTGGQQAIYQFDRTVHRVDEVPDLPHEVWIHCDFNVYPMAATIYHYIPTHPIKLWGVDEVNLHGADTEELCQALEDKIGPGWHDARVFPDAMGGRQRHSAAKKGTTDLRIMEDFGFKNLEYELSYSVRDQLNAANALVHKGLVRWHRRCEETIRDLERVKIKVGGHDLDKSDPLRTHWLDGFKNMVHCRFPVVKSYSQVNSRRIR